MKESRKGKSDPQRTPLFSVGNRHVSGCGVPPSIHAEAGNRYSYFENEHGEQFVAVFDRKKKRIKLRAGDLGWQKEFTLRRHQGEIVAVSQGNDAALLNILETRWLETFVEACGEALPPWKPRPKDAVEWEWFRTMRYVHAKPAWSRMHAVKVFISSPSDVARERAAAVDVCIDLGKTLQLPIQPILWEGGGRKHPQVPGFPSALGSSPPQQAIDDFLWNAIGGCDIFVGIAWHRMGTATGVFRSGTEAELVQAQTFQQQRHRPSRIMFYHKTAPLPPRTTDPSQLSVLRDFIQELRKGGLIREVESLGAFRRALKHDLTEAVTDLLNVDPIWRRFAEQRETPV